MCFEWYGDHRELHVLTHSFPTRRSSHLIRQGEPMKITDIRFGMLRVPLKTPFKTALRTVETVADIVVSIHTDTGHVGYGAATATAVPTRDTHGSIVSAINTSLAPRLFGAGISTLHRITRLTPAAPET